MASAYTGPLDLVPGAVFGYSMRALSAARLGENLFRLKRDSDEAEMNFVAALDFATWEGGPDTDAMTAWIGEATPTLITLFDQVGSNDITDALPLYFEFPSQGGRPAAALHAASHPVTYTFSTGKFLVAAVHQAGIEMNVPGEVGVESFDFESSYSGDFVPLVYANDNAGNEAGGTFTGIGGALDFLLSVGAWEFGTRSFRINNEDSSEAAALDAGGALGGYTVTLLNLTSYSVAQELIGWAPAALPDAATRLALTQNIATYYGITLQ